VSWKADVVVAGSIPASKVLSLYDESNKSNDQAGITPPLHDNFSFCDHYIATRHEVAWLYNYLVSEILTLYFKRKL
jgi:hypothetical protein